MIGAVDGKAAESKVMVSPLFASHSAWRNVPGPLSSALVTTIVFPFGIGVIVAVGIIDATGVAEGDGLGSQLHKLRESMAIRKSGKAIFFIM